MNSFRIRPLLGIAAAILLLAGFAAGPVQAQRGSVTGQVTDKSNQQAVTGASVLVVGTNLQGRTNREGRYTITNVPAGQYQVQVRLIGYATATNPVSVSAGQAATADFALTPAAVPLIVVVDGVRIDNTPNADGGLGVGGQAPSRLNDLNGDDIESIEVVKGPSAAALYGTDAANGVIQI